MSEEEDVDWESSLRAGGMGSSGGRDRKLGRSSSGSREWSAGADRGSSVHLQIRESYGYWHTAEIGDTVIMQ